jgi:hypothetical protein
MIEILLGGVNINTAADIAAIEALEAVTLSGEVDSLVDLAGSDDSVVRNSPTFATLEATTATIEVLCDVSALRQRRFTSSSDLSGRN